MEEVKQKFQQQNDDRRHTLTRGELMRCYKNKLDAVARIVGGEEVHSRLAVFGFIRRMDVC